MKRKKINCETARNFPVTEALEKLGHFPKRETEQDAWFLSPFRSETQASLKVSKRKNRWYDHGEGVGGNVIDLVSRVLKCSIEETLEFLDDGMAIRPIKQRPIFNKKEPKIDIVKVRDIMHPALVEYLSFRYIPITVAKRHCKEVWYQYKDNRFFAIGLENIKGGWELRNKLFKNGSSPKSYTYLQYNKSQLIILEGMFDLLSLATLDGTEIKASDIIVLNSVAFIKDIETHIGKYESVHLYLDNDKAGQQATKYLMNNYNHVKDRSSSYKNHKDLNDMICHEQ